MSKSFPHPPPHLDGGPGACAEIMVEAASGPSPWGSGHFQGQPWRSWEMLSVRPQTSKAHPAAPTLPLPSRAGSSFSCRVGGPHHPNLPPGSRKALPARVTLFGIGIQGLPSDLLSWGLGMGACSCRSGLSYPLSTFGEQPRRPRRGRERDEPGRKLDSADRASRLANSSLLSFCLSFPQPFVGLGFPC